MSKPLIIATNSANASQRNAITRHLKNQGWEIWHWFDHLWLVASVPDQIESADVLEELLLATKRPDLHLIVMEPDDHGQAFFFGCVCEDDAMPWLAKHWVSEDSDPPTYEDMNDDPPASRVRRIRGRRTAKDS